MSSKNSPRRKQPVIDGNELSSHVITSFRRLSDISGPGDRLQTREFRTACEAITSIHKWIETPLTIEANKSETFALRKALEERYSLHASLNYLLYFWPLHLYEALSLLAEVPTAPRKALDIGSGPGSYALGALLHGASDVTLFDQSEFFLRAAGDLVGRWGFPIRIHRGLWPKDPLPREEFDLITIGHAIYEMSQGLHDTAFRLVEDALNALSEDGFLLLTTSSEESKNRWFLELRDKICAKGYEIQAPCIWQGACPAKKHHSSPCYAQRKWEKPYFLKELQRGAGIFLNSLKMSYLLIRSPKMVRRRVAVEPLYRVISPPIDMLGEKRFFLCGTEGKKHIGLRARPDNEPLPKSLKPFQFLERGSLITFSHILEKNEAVDLVQDSTISLVAPCDRPVPEEKDVAFGADEV